jgi:hypothetical protein
MAADAHGVSRRGVADPADECKNSLRRFIDMPPAVVWFGAYETEPKNHG